MWLKLINGFEIVPNLFGQKLRHLNDPNTFGRLGISNDILALKPLIGFCDRQEPLFQIEIRFALLKLRGQTQYIKFFVLFPLDRLKHICYT